jgi:hypothetical protein
VSSKISALPVATSMAPSDLLTIVQGGVNKSIDRPAMLADVSGFGITIADAAGAIVQVSGTGQVVIHSDASQPIQMTTGAGNEIQMDDFTGYSNFVAVGGWNISSFTGSTVSIDGSGVIALETFDGSSVIIAYTPSASGSWSGDPFALATAVDRIAAAVAGLLGHAIP